MMNERHNPDCGSLLPLVKGSPAAGSVSAACEVTPLSRGQSLDASNHIPQPSGQQGWLRRAAAGCRSPGLCLLWMATSAFSQIASFPGAEGFGSASAGGRGGDVYTVTNLNASGAGSLFEAISTIPANGRTIVFAVSGHIRLPSGSGGTTVSGSKLTIAGQTAPGDGICFWNNAMTFSGNDVVLRHLRWRYGKQAAGGDAVDINASQRIIMDHCEQMFSTDENLSSFGTPPEYFTYQWSVNAWGLQTHSAGGLWDINHATAHHTLWANNHTRNPKCISPSVFDWVNNVIFGWDLGFNFAPSTDTTARVNIRGSTFSHGGSTSSAAYGGGLNAGGTNVFKVHIADSALDGNNNGVLDMSKSNYAIVASGVLYDQQATAWPQTVNGVTGGTAIGTAVTVDPRLTAYKKVLSQVGATRMEIGSRPLRDEISQLCVTRTAAMQRGIIADPLELNLSTGTAFADLRSSPAPTDTDGDGMPDYWESAVGLSTTTADNNSVLTAPQIAASFFPAGTPTGYTRLEEYLHFKAVAHGVVGRNTAASPSFVDIDLSKFTSGFTASPVFTVSGVTGGTISQSGTGGKIARFTPTLETFGRAGFLFTVTDAAGSTWTQQCCLIVTQTPPPRPVTWTGDGTTNNWDTTTANWVSLAGATTFADTDAVTFDGSGSNSPTIKLIGTLQPDSVTVDTSVKNFTLTGTGALTGGVNFVKTGAGTLTISNTGANAISTMLLDGGTLTTGAGSTLGAAALTVTSATLNFGGDLSGPLSLSGTLNLNPTGSRSFNCPWSGSGIVNINNTGSSLLTLGGSMSAFDGEVRFGASTGSARLYGSTGCATARWDLGTGTFNLFTRNGGSNFVLGELAGGPNTLLSGASSTTTTTVYTVGAMNTSSTFAGRIGNGSGTALTALTKVGTGKLTLTHNNCTYTGATTVNAGELEVNGTLAATPVTVNSGARLSGTGTLGGSVTTTAGGIIAPGGDGAGTLTAASLALTSPTLEFDLSANASAGNDQIVVNGPVTLTNAQTFVFNFTGGVLGAGTYTLISSTGAITGTNATLVSNLPTGSRQTLTLERSADGVAPGYVRLVVSGANADLTWTGANGGLWDLQTTSAWSGASPATFYNNDRVTFEDSATSGSVTITRSVAPQSLTVNNSTRAYTFTGAPITGGTSLVKSGTGTLTLNVPQYTLTCGTTINTPNVSMASTAGLYPGMSVVGSMFPADTVINTVSAGSITVSQNATATNGTASLIFESRNTFTGGTVINGGEVFLTSNAAPTSGRTAPANPFGLGSGPITLNGGTLTLHGNTGSTSPLYGTFSNDLIVPAGATATLQNTMRGTSVVPYPSLSGKLTGSGTLNYVGNYFRAAVTGDWSAFTGTINAKRPTTSVSDPRFQFGAETGLPLATLNLEQVRMEYTAASTSDVTIPIGALSGITTASISGSQNNTTPVTYRVGGLGSSTTYAGSWVPFSGGGAIGVEKTGAGTWTITGSGTVNAGITVEQGTLSYGDGSNDTFGGTGDIVVFNGATLQLNSGATLNAAVLDIAASATFRGRGTVNADVTASGLVHSNSGVLTLNGDAVFTGTAAVNLPTSQFVSSGTVSLGGPLDLMPSVGLATGASFTILSKTSVGAAIGTFTARPEGCVWSEDGYLWRITYLGGDGNDVVVTIATALDLWRWQNFGTSQNTGPAADLADQDSDGATNLLEYAMKMNPATNDVAPLSATKNGSVLEFIYTKNKSATDVTFTVEWSDDLATWSTAGVTSSVLTDNGITQQIKALVPAGVNQRFAHLRVTRP